MLVDAEKNRSGLCMKKMGYLTIGVVVGTLIGSSLVGFAQDQIKLIVNGKEIQSDVPPQVINGRTMVPYRVLAEALGAKVQWASNNNTVVVNSDNSATLPTNKKQSTYLSNLKPYHTGSSTSMMSNNDPNTRIGTQGSPGKMTIGGISFDEGIAIDSSYYDGDADYNLSGKYKTLSFKLGTDDCDDTNVGSALFTVLGNDKVIFTRVVKSANLVSDQIDIDVSGVSKLTIQTKQDTYGYYPTVDMVNPVLK